MVRRRLRLATPVMLVRARDELPVVIWTGRRTARAEAAG